MHRPMSRSVLRPRRFIAAAVVGSLVGCTTDDIQFGDREPFNPPPDAVAGFLGYFPGSEGLTTCSNCHAGSQAEWDGTAHAGAVQTLVTSGDPAAFCFECHTVNERGNAIAQPAGWNVAADPVYHDVQCESCHGPGRDHVENPGLTQPIPTLDVPVALDDGCAECHQGNHHPFAEEWAQSKHASVVSFAAAREECAGCHRGQDVLRAWGVRGQYRERDAAEHLAITCGVCHDPHDPTNEGQLRFPVRTASLEEHLCARCHDRRTAPDPSDSHGLAPHAPETALLLGDAGWFPPDLDIDQGQIVGSHGSVGNPRLCAGCHVNQFTVTDQETGSFVFNATGHLFTGLPCVDADGIPQPGPCPVTTTDRSFAACAASGCHQSETDAFNALSSATTEVLDRAADLLNVLVQVDQELGQPGGEIDPTNSTFTVAEGAYFNYNLANFGQTSEGSPPTIETVLGSSVHNPFLIRALLLGSINAVEAEYGVTPTVPSRSLAGTPDP